MFVIYLLGSIKPKMDNSSQITSLSDSFSKRIEQT